MEGLEYLILGVASFGVAALFDLATLWKRLGLKPALGLLAVLTLGYSTQGLIRISPRLAIPAPLVRLGWPLLTLSVALLVYSLFIEIPFRGTYDHGQEAAELVTTGTYALCRHPAVLWFALLLAALTLVSRARLLLVAGPVWVLLDAVIAWSEDRYYFPRMFRTYRHYQAEVPMLIPTASSFARCIRTFFSVEGVSALRDTQRSAYPTE